MRPGRRTFSHPDVVVLTVPAFGPWDDRAAPSCSRALELRFPAARGYCPDVPKVLLRWNGAAQAADAYRVGESRSNYPSVIPGRPNSLMLTSRSKWKTPHLRSAQVGRWYAPSTERRITLRRESFQSSPCTDTALRSRISTSNRFDFAERDVHHADLTRAARDRVPARANTGGARLSHAVELAKRE